MYFIEMLPNNRVNVVIAGRSRVLDTMETAIIRARLALAGRAINEPRSYHITREDQQEICRRFLSVAAV